MNVGMNFYLDDLTYLSFTKLLMRDLEVYWSCTVERCIRIK
jgi:hypothetical protein